MQETIFPYTTNFPTRSVGAFVVMVNGALTGYLSRGGTQVFAYLPEDEVERTRAAQALAQKLAELAQRPESHREGVLISEVNGAPAAQSDLASYLAGAGFVGASQGFHLLRRPFDVTSPAESLLLQSVGRGER
jgi:ATP-dependent Lhr-like helicase